MGHQLAHADLLALPDDRLLLPMMDTGTEDQESEGGPCSSLGQSGLQGVQHRQSPDSPDLKASN